MKAVRRQLRPLTWVALVAFWALALLPTLSHAFAAQRTQGAGGWAEVCTTQGPQRVAVDAEGRLVDTVIDAAGPGSAHLQHCPLCALSLDAPMLPAAAPAALALARAAEAAPAARSQAWRERLAWRSAQPRGPPAFS